MVCCHAPALAAQTVDVKLTVNNAVCEPRRLRQHSSVLGNEVVSAKDKVGRRFPVSRARIEISADQARRLVGDKRLPVNTLPGILIARRKIYKHRRARQRVPRARRIGRPQILTDLGCHCQPFHFPADKQKILSERHRAALKFRPGNRSLSRREMTRLVKLRIIRQEALRHQSEQPSPADCRRHIVKLLLFLPRKSDKHQSVPHSRGIHNFAQPFLCRRQQPLLPEKIAAGIARDAKLRKYNDFRPGVRRFFRLRADLRRIVYAVRYFQFRCHRRRLHKSMPHGSTSCFVILRAVMPGSRVYIIPSAPQRKTHNLYCRNDSSPRSAFPHRSSTAVLFFQR